MLDIAHGENDSSILKQAINLRGLDRRVGFSPYRASRYRDFGFVLRQTTVLPQIKQDVPCRPKSSTVNRGSTL